MAEPKKEDHFGNYEKDTLTKPRDKAWDNWAKFAKVGDKVQGYIRDVFFRPAEGDFKAQRGVTLETPKGEMVNVAIKRFSFILAKTNSLRLGDPLTVVFEEQKAPARKGVHGVKIFGFYGKNLEENKNNKTVLELDNEDRIAQGLAEEKEEGDAVVTPENAAKKPGDFDDFKGHEEKTA
jgi:hypothetical protein